MSHAFETMSGAQSKTDHFGAVLCTNLRHTERNRYNAGPASSHAFAGHDRYQKRNPGPLLDQIDIHMEVPRIEYEKLADRRLGEPSAKVRQRVQEARERQRARFAENGAMLNSDMGPAEIRDHCRLDEAGERLLKAAVQQLQLSARAYHRVLKLSRTIADLAASDHIETSHLAEAPQYRLREWG